MVALGLIASIDRFGDTFAAFALVALPGVLFVGLATFIRIGAVNYHDAMTVTGMNRIRGAYLALIALAIGLREVAGHRRVAPHLAATFLVVAAIFGCMNAFMTFVQVDYWKNSGWDQVPAAIMVAVGRDVDLMNGLTRWAGIASYAALAIALYYLGRACRSGGVLPGWLGVVAYVGAAILVAMIVVSQVSDADALSNLLSLAIGMVVAPIVTIGLGVHIARAASCAPAPVDGRS